MSDTGQLTIGVLSGDDLRNEDALRNLCFAHPVFRERYEGWDVVGQGAYATVVKTHCVDRGETVALKIFRFASDEDDRRRFRLEVQNAQRVGSPLLVQTYSPFDQGGIRWIEMEYVEGTNLDDELRRREAASEPFAFGEALDIAACVATALALAHREKVIHRDLKPANILLPRSRQPLAKLADFGISRFTGADKLTSTGVFAGTPKFGSPEAFKGEPLGPAHDVYSLGLSLYLLFTNNRFPFALPADYSLPALVAVHTRRPPQSARTFVPDLDARLEALLAQCLEKKPGRRPTAEAVRAELERIREAGLGVGAASPRTAFTRRRRLAAAAVGVMAAATVAWSVAVKPAAGPTVAISRARRPPPVASPAAEASPPVAAPAPFQLRLDGAFVEVRNGKQAVDRLEVQVVTADGRVHRTAWSERIGANETGFVALDSFEPAVKRASDVVEVRSQGMGSSGPVQASVQLK